MFNIFTGTVWSKTHYDCSTIAMLLRGFAKGVPTKWLTDEMDLAYPSVLKRRHRIQEAVREEERVGFPAGFQTMDFRIQRSKPMRCIKMRGKKRSALGSK